MTNSNVYIKIWWDKNIPKVIHFSTNEITQKELNNLLVESHLSQDEREKTIVKRRKELGYVECKDASWKILDPTQANDVY